MAPATPAMTRGEASPALQMLSETPPLAGLCALAAAASTTLNQVVVPALPGGTRHAWYVPLDHAGRYAENLAVIAGTIALLFSSFSALRAPAFSSPRRRVLLVVFLTVLLRAVAIATLLERDSTTRGNVYYAVGAANVLCVFAGMAVLDGARSLLTRVIAGLAIATPMIGMFAITLEVTTDVVLDPWTSRVHTWLAGSDEVSYLTLLLVSAPLLVPRAMKARAAFARMIGFAVLLASLLGLTYAQRKLGADFSIFMYRAQHVALLLERLPVAYALPIGVGAGAALCACVAGGARFQAGAAMWLIIAAGNAPAAPGRLLCMTLGYVLLSRAVASLDAFRHSAHAAVSPSTT